MAEQASGFGNGAGSQGQGFDRVQMELEGGARRQLSRAQYERLPLPERIKALLEGHLKFYRGDQEISSREALRDL